MLANSCVRVWMKAEEAGKNNDHLWVSRPVRVCLKSLSHLIRQKNKD